MLIDKKLIKKQRVIRYFIQAATEIAQNDGMEAITIRNVSEGAGYNSATLYNYFENLEQLLAFTSINCISDYWDDIAQISLEKNTPVDRYIQIWKLYCQHSFANPSIYNYVFTITERKNILKYMRDFYELFPDKYEKFPQDIKDIIIESDPKKRDYMFLLPCIKEGYFKEDDVQDIIEFAYLLYYGLMYQILNFGDAEAEDFSEVFLKYFKPYIKGKSIK